VRRSCDDYQSRRPAIGIPSTLSAENNSCFGLRMSNSFDKPQHPQFDKWLSLTPNNRLPITVFSRCHFVNSDTIVGTFIDSHGTETGFMATRSRLFISLGSVHY
jgi:hypothetical protein